VVDGKCAAQGSADCRKSARCKLEGNCTAKDGACIAASNVDCQASSVCQKVKRCQAKDGACISAGGGKAGPGSSGPPDKTRSTSMEGLAL
jgi:hypothetical protein